MDNLDHITDLEQGLLELRLKAVTQKTHRPSARTCVGCDNVIPEERRSALPGVQLCVGCKEVEEVRQRNFGGRA